MPTSGRSAEPVRSARRLSRAPAGDAATPAAGFGATSTDARLDMVLIP